MGFVLKWLSGPAGVWIVVVVAATIAGLSFTSYALYQRAERYQNERDEFRRDNVRLLADVQSKHDVITELEAGLLQWQTRANESAAASQKAGDRADRYASDLRVARSRISALIEQDKGKVECDALLELDIAAACPGHAERVREWSRRSVAGPNR
jgi:hypothetical protein